MQTTLALLSGIVFACGVFLILRRNMVKFVFGLALISQGINMGIFTAGGLVRHRAPLIPSDQDLLAAGSADPLPQAMILTAIVIGFGILAFTIVLILRTYEVFGQVDIDEVRAVDR